MAETTWSDVAWEFLIGRKKKTPPSIEDWINSIREGLPAFSAQRASKTLDIPMKEISSVLHISQKTIERRISQKKPLDLITSDRLVQVARVFGRTVEVMGDKGRAKAWMFRPSFPLGNKIPFQLLDTTTGVDLVLDELGRIEHGIAV